MDMEMEKPMETKQDAGNGAATASPVLTPQTAFATTPTASSNKANLNKTILIAAIIIALTLLVSAILGAWMIGRDRKQSVGYNGIATEQYQAVFLTNGQVYFGKLSDSGPELVKLTNIWYLQVQSGSQTTSAEALKNDQSQISLAKLGNELHGPDDSMSISKDQVLFWENLKNDSKVVKTIKEAK